VVTQSDPYFLVPILKSCAELVSLYPRNNPALERNLDSLVQRVAEILGEEPHFTIVFDNDTIVIRDKPITNNQFKRPQAQWMLNLASKNQIGELTFFAGVGPDDLYHLGKILHEASQKRVGWRELQETCEKECRGTLKFAPPGGNPNEPIGQQEPKGQPETLQPGPKDHSFKGNLKPTQEANEHRLFTLSEEDKRTLAQYVQMQLRKGNKGQLFQNLNEMIQDMNTFDQESSYLGCNSLKISIETLINVGEVEILHKLHEELYAFLPGVPRDDIFSQIIEIQVQTLRYLRFRQLLSPYLAGLEHLAQLIQFQKSERRTHLVKALNQLMDTKMTGFLLSIGTQDHPLKERSQSLFKRYCREMATPLFRLLFNSENRAERKLILAQLTQAGEAIQPLLLEHLKLAIKQNSPWYVKRNLLFLLCKFPTNELAAYIDDLKNEKHPRLREQLMQACLRLKSPKTVEYGTRVVSEMTVESIQSLLPIISQFENKAYDQVLIQKFHETQEEALQIKLMRTLQALDTTRTRAFFQDILSAKKVMSLRYSGPLRSEAAKSLYRSAGRSIFQAFIPFKDDREPEVRHYARRFIAEKSANNAHF